MDHAPFTSGQIESLLSRAAELRLSRRARARLLVLRHYAESDSVTATCRQFAIPRMTLYRLLGRFNPAVPSSLEDRSRRPHAAGDGSRGAGRWRPLRRTLAVASLILNAVLAALLLVATLTVLDDKGRPPTPAPGESREIGQE